MGRSSTKADKNRFHISREDAHLTREAASEKLGISPDRIEKIENRGAMPYPDEVLAMSKQYGNPMLCNHYCANCCPIGQEFIPEVKLKDVSQITLEVLANLNKLTKSKDRLIDITVDGQIDEDEVKDFNDILDALNKMSLTIDALKMWAKNEMASGSISPDSLNI